ncbi:Heavy-chain fibroin [Candidatus Paraburkholderia kirkii]|nr:Heavy-chain fibroin [Candidatus Paraburkholderia kirkii]
MILLSVMLAACGGGGDDSHSSSSSGGSSGGSGSGGGSSSTSTANAQPSAPNGTNAVPINVNSGVAQFVNIPNVSVTVCAPGSSTCQTIDNIQVDTASFCLRILGSSAQSVLGSLPGTRAANGGQLAECAGFADGYTWGTVRTADVKIGTEVASGVPIQIIGDLDASSAPTGNNGCPSGNDENSIADIGANGILGIGPQTYDCGSGCVSTALNAMYFSCANGANCAGTTVPLTQQVTNPITKFPVDNNGVIVQLPPVPDGGATSATGVLIFGIGTQSNNAVAGVTKYGTDQFGDLTGTYKGNTYTTFFDSGSNGNFFQDSFALCSSQSAFYCPSSEQSLSVTIRGTEGNTSVVPFQLVNARTLTQDGTKFAFNSFGGQLGIPSYFDFGLPFFFGRHVYVGFELPNSPAYVAF